MPRRAAGPSRPAVRTATLLLVLVVGSLVAAGLAGPATAAERPRDAVSGDPPVTVYRGEELDVTRLGLTGGGTVGAGEVTFVGIAGNASGRIETVDPTEVDFEGWATGGYDVNDDDRIELSVARPRVTDLTLRLANGADVTNRWAPADARLTLTARFTFAAADGLAIEVVGPNGLDVAPSVASRTRIHEDGGTVAIDFSEVASGRYTVTAEARNLEANRSVAVDVGTARYALTPEPRTVVAGEPIRVTVEADPDEQYVLRIPAADLADRSATDAAARRVFADEGAVTARRGSADHDVVYATLRIDGGRTGEVVLRSEHLRAGGTVQLDLGRGTNPGASTLLRESVRVEAETTPTTAPPTTTDSPTPTTTSPGGTTTTTDSPTPTTTTSPTETRTATDSPAPTTTTATTAAPDGQPGFGVVAAVAGAVAAVLLARRRG